MVFFQIIIISEPAGTQVNLTKYRQIAADLLGLPVDQVSISLAATQVARRLLASDVVLIVTVKVADWSHAATVMSKSASDLFQADLSAACQTQALPSASVVRETIGYANVSPTSTTTAAAVGPPPPPNSLGKSRARSYRGLTLAALLSCCCAVFMY